MSTEAPTQELAAREVDLPEPVARRGISEAQWRTLANNLFPGAAPQSVLMVWDYCMARKLDPLKKPCHIVPMRVKDVKTGEWGWRDVVMPGIYEYRTTAQRTGDYLGHSRPEYGPTAEYAGVKAPEWCEMTVYRATRHGLPRAEFPVRRFFAEVVGLTKEGRANDRWSKAPIQMLEKCTEAAGLREAFPDEFGGEPTFEEMDDQRVVDATPVPRIQSPQPAQRKSLSQAPANTEPESARPGVPQSTASPSPVGVVPSQSGDSGQIQPAATPGTIGVITDILPRTGGVIIKLDNGFQAAAKSVDEAVIRGAQMAKESGQRVELVVKPSSDPTKYAAVVTTVKLAPVEGAQS